MAGLNNQLEEVALLKNRKEACMRQWESHLVLLSELIGQLDFFFYFTFSLRLLLMFLLGVT